MALTLGYFKRRTGEPSSCCTAEKRDELASLHGYFRTSASGSHSQSHTYF
jgi:hypothetical protein